MDVIVQLRKADVNGNPLQNTNVPLTNLQMKAEDVVSVDVNKYINPTRILGANRRKNRSATLQQSLAHS
jgi:hypothetical protein